MTTTATFSRVCVIVLDSVGIGALPDAHVFNDCQTHTLGNIYKARGRLDLPNLYRLGLGNIEDARLPKVEAPAAAYGRMAGQAPAKDTTSGHWELMGHVMDKPFATFDRFPETLLEEWLKRADYKPCAGLLSPPRRGWLGNCAASGTQILDRLGEAHLQTGAPIVYTSADSVFQVAAHEDVIGLETLYHLCETARGLLQGDYLVGRVIARPFAGRPGGFVRTQGRKDYAVPPTGETVPDALTAQDKKVLGIGKIEDIFCGRGITHSRHTHGNADGIRATIDALRHGSHDLIFTNLVDFDMLYGHRNDVEGYAAALEYFDAQLPEILAAMRRDDLLLITADHGCDPTFTASTDHSREYVPVLAYGGKAVDLGTRQSFADAGATVYQILTKGAWNIGKSFLSQI